MSSQSGTYTYTAAIILQPVESPLLNKGPTAVLRPSRLRWVIVGRRGFVDGPETFSEQYLARMGPGRIDACDDTGSTANLKAAAFKQSSKSR
jgi:hypothetical protein